ncbi:MAG TPA: beta-ketoacyl synthase N-terminal-like domain-containing protein [Longimicrobium sp.]|jgi:3-oxoacyl-[acyl-carrier-protein] synthase II|uniref:beta-ketoacyl synthase N-terminal-like domain-containing protein n=1 Tax=Longimicrobium sp. TaxID=2029185 RepID=UPI002ED8096F
MYGPNDDARVVMTSYGFCIPAGSTDAPFADALLRGAQAAPVAKVDDTALDAALATHIPWGEQRRMDRLTKLGVLASMECFKRSGLEITEENCDDVGGIYGCAFGPIASTRDFMASGKKGIKGASPLIFPYTVVNACPGIATILLGMRGPSSTVSGSNPVTYSYDLLQTGRASALMTGGFEELTPEIVSALEAPMAAGLDERVQAIDGQAEGAAVLLLETAEFAAARGAQAICEIVGYGQAMNLTEEKTAIENMGHIDPAAIHASMRQALQTTGTDAGDIGLVVSLARGDNGQRESEAQAVDALWGGEARPELREPKARLGETFAASETLGIIAARFYAECDPAAFGGRAEKLAMVNGYQLGGNVTSVIVKF